MGILPQKKTPTVNAERLVGNAELFPYRDKYPRMKLWRNVCTSCDLPDLVAGCPYKTLLVLWMVSPNPPPSSTLLPKSTLDSSVLMTITLEPLVRRLTLHGKETISNARPLPQTTHSDQRLNPSPAKSTDLLQRFIEAFKEVESYRYARRDWSCSRHVLNNFLAEMEIRSSLMDTTFPSQPLPPPLDTMRPSLLMTPLVSANGFNRAGM